MLSFGVKDNFAAVSQQFQKTMGSQVPFATSLALNRTAQLARQALDTTMRAVFDRPTPFTLNSLYTKNSTKTDLTATVGSRPGRAGALSPSASLKAEIEGGGRSLKSLEKLVGGYLVPTKYTPLDAYGNVPGSLVRQIMAVIKSGPLNLSQARSRNRQIKKGTFREYILIPKNNPDGKPPGIYIQRSNGSIVPILFFSRSAPHYQQRYDLEGVVNRVFEAEYNKQFIAAMDYAMATAKIKIPVK